jgi:hypothetical protein
MSAVSLELRRRIDGTACRTVSGDQPDAGHWATVGEAQLPDVE